MNSNGSERDPVERLAEEFAERYRRGERPTPEEYALQYPQLADQIRELFPALAVLEQFGSVAEAADPPPAGPAAPGPAGGTTLGRLGEYRILREVGRGGMGVVYEAVQESLGRHVALKVLPFHGATNAVYLERFRREAQAAARLHHTNIVPVFGVGEHEGVHYYAMQFIQGQSLDAVLREVKRIKGEKCSLTEPGRTGDPNATRSLALKLLTGSLPVPDTMAAVEAAAAPPTPDHAPSSASGSQSELASRTEAQYFRETARMAFQVAEALAHAHQHGIVHRDVKPSNLLVDGDGIVWVTDFGLAKAEGSGELTHTGDILGTLRYMAPERFQGVSDVRGDVYGLGVTLYEMLTLRPAFDDADRARLVQRVTNENPLRPRQIDPHVPRDLETIVLKAMAKEPADRYPSAAAMAEDLLRYVEDRPIRARRASLAERAWQWRRRNPVLAAVGGLAVAALLASVVLSLALAYQQWQQAVAAKDAAAAIAKKQEETLAALNKFERLSADLEVDKTLSTCDKGALKNGMLRLADCLDLATRAGPPDLEQGIRANLAAWRRELRPLRMAVAHSDMVAAVAFSPDGKTLLTGSYDCTARRWDAATGEPVGELIRRKGQVRAVAWSQDGEIFATGSGFDDWGEVCLWDAASGRRLFAGPLPHPMQVRAVAFSPDGQDLLIGGIDWTAALWEVRTGRRLLEKPRRLFDVRHQGQVQSVAFSPDGGTLLTGSHDATARLWDAKTGKELPQSPIKGDGGEVWVAVFSPDGKWILTGGMGQTAQLWDAATGAAHVGEPLPLHAGICTAAFSPDGATILTADTSGKVAFWGVKTGRPVGRPLKHLGTVRAAAFRADGKAVLTGCDDGLVRLWDVSPEAEANFPLPDPQGEVAGAAFSPDGEALVVGGAGGTARQWAASTGRPWPGEPLRHSGEIDAVAYSPDGGSVMTGSLDGSARLWRAKDGAPTGVSFSANGPILAASFSPDGRTLATSNTATGAVYFWNPATGKPAADPPAWQGEYQGGGGDIGLQPRRARPPGGDAGRDRPAVADERRRQAPVARSAQSARELVRRVQPGRPNLCHRKRGRHGPALGGRDGKADRPPGRAWRPGPVRGLRPRRPDLSDRERRRRRPALADRDGQGDRPCPAVGRPRRGRDLQPRR